MHLYVPHTVSHRHKFVPDSLLTAIRRGRCPDRLLADRLGRGKTMIKFKACGRCGGDVYFNADRRGVDVYCLQCGSRRHFSAEEMRALTADKLAAAQIADGSQKAA